jgi:hypothetical protein
VDELVVAEVEVSEPVPVVALAPVDGVLELDGSVAVEPAAVPWVVALEELDGVLLGLDEDEVACAKAAVARAIPLASDTSMIVRFIGVSMVFSPAPAGRLGGSPLRLRRTFLTQNGEKAALVGLPPGECFP